MRGASSAFCGISSIVESGYSSGTPSPTSKVKELPAGILSPCSRFSPLYCIPITRSGYSDGTFCVLISVNPTLSGGVSVDR